MLHADTPSNVTLPAARGAGLLPSASTGMLNALSTVCVPPRHVGCSQHVTSN
jgi:hypothetical protein